MFLSIFVFQVKYQNFLEQRICITKKTRKWICIDGRLKHAFPSRDLCLETGARFRDYQYRCHFNPSTAEDILQDGKLFKMIFVIDA